MLIKNLNFKFASFLFLINLKLLLLIITLFNKVSRTIPLTCRVLLRHSANKDIQNDDGWQIGFALTLSTGLLIIETYQNFSVALDLQPIDCGANFYFDLEFSSSCLEKGLLPESLYQAVWLMPDHPRCGLPTNWCRWCRRGLAPARTPEKCQHDAKDIICAPFARFLWLDNSVNWWHCSVVILQSPIFPGRESAPHEGHLKVFCNIHFINGNLVIYCKIYPVSVERWNGSVAQIS